MRKALVKSWGADQESIRIGPLSDIHLGSPQFSERAFTQFLDQVEGDPDFYLVLNGDYIENITRSSIGELWEQRMTPSEQIREVAARLMRVKDRILCVTEGNHELRSRKETSFEPARMLVEKMGLAEELYQPEGAVVVVRLGYCSRENRKTPMVYTLYVTHGSTGGRLPGAKIVAADRLGQVVEGVDVVVMGHVHDMISRKTSVMRVDTHTRNVEPRVQVQLVAGAFLEWGGYSQRQGYHPGAVGMPSVLLSGRGRQMEIRM